MDAIIGEIQGSGEPLPVCGDDLWDFQKPYGISYRFIVSIS